MRNWTLGLLAAVLVSIAAPSSAAVLYTDYAPGNDCVGLFNDGEQGFSNCEDPRGSPIIAKFDTGDEENPALWSINTGVFADVTSAMFTLTFDEADGSIGQWAYNQCATCPAITSFVVKAGNGFRWYYTLPLAGLTSGEWVTPGEKGLSHISFYDSLGTPDPQAVIPLPMPIFLLLGGIGTLAAVRRRKVATRS